MIPITYLLCLAIILTPILALLVLQVLDFYKKESTLSEFIVLKEKSNLLEKEKYKIANICINHKIWSLALTILEDELHQNSNVPLYWQAKYYNAIGFIFYNIKLNTVAKSYYGHAYKLNPEYLCAKKNFDSLS